MIFFIEKLWNFLHFVNSVIDDDVSEIAKLSRPSLTKTWWRKNSFFNSKARTTDNWVVLWCITRNSVGNETQRRRRRSLSADINKDHLAGCRRRENFWLCETPHKRLPQKTNSMHWSFKYFFIHRNQLSSRVSIAELKRRENLSSGFPSALGCFYKSKKKISIKLELQKMKFYL